MLEIAKNPNTFYADRNFTINQEGLTQAIWDYYWTSYSRGTDGSWSPNDPNWNNEYLNGYNQKRTKSLYDPCPYGFRIPINGTYNKLFNSYYGWKQYSYIGGANNVTNTVSSWFVTTGVRYYTVGFLNYVGVSSNYRTSTSASRVAGYELLFDYMKNVSRNNMWEKSLGYSIRCIEDEIQVL